MRTCIRDPLEHYLFVHIFGLLREYQVVSVEIAAVEVFSICLFAVFNH